MNKERGFDPHEQAALEVRHEEHKEKTTLRSAWTIEEAQALAAHLLPHLLSMGFHLGIAGSVALVGRSDNDLDLIVYPLNATRADVQDARDMLTTAGLKCLMNHHRVARAWRERGSTDTKHVEVWSYRGKRVDVFFLR